MFRGALEGMGAFVAVESEFQKASLLYAENGLEGRVRMARRMPVCPFAEQV